jgi:hypothetical protein
MKETSMQSATRPQASRSLWLRQLHQWHWISSALCLLGMVLFAVTGITLNHAAQIEAQPSVSRNLADAPPEVQAELRLASERHAGKTASVPPATQNWLRATWSLDVGGRSAEWSPEELYLALPRPGGDAWLRIGIDDGAAEYELTSRGPISWLNDVHKGRNTGVVWSWFIDLFAGACLVFCLTGLLILKFHASNRPFTWPMVGLGILIPCVLAILFIH